MDNRRPCEEWFACNPHNPVAITETSWALGPTAQPQGPRVSQKENHK